MQTLILFYYDIGLMMALAVFGPFLLIKKKARAGLTQKFANLPKAFQKSLPADEQTVWLHAVSVGEFTAVLPFIKVFHERYPDKKIVISTTTATGNKLAQELVGDFASIFYFPFDLSWVIKKVFDTVRPAIVFVAETELWPRFTHECAKRNIPLVLLNGRISPRSYRSYKMFSFIFGPMLKSFSLIGTQSKIEAQRYETIAGQKLPVQALGNLKYDNLVAPDQGEATILRRKLGIEETDHVLVAGSTHEGEEHMVLEALRDLRPSDDKGKYKLIIAPRHPERFQRVAEIIRSFGLRPRHYSKNEALESDQDVYVLDAIGFLAKHYSVATVAFVGGTIAKVGGHSLLEPYAYGVPVVCGPHLFKTKETAKILREQGALLIGKNALEVQTLIGKLFADPTLRRKMGDAGNSWLIDNQGAVERAFTAVEKLMIARGLTNSKEIENLYGNTRQRQLLQTSNPNRRGAQL